MIVHFVVAAYHPATSYGGPITKIDSLAPHLAASGCEILVITSQLRGPGLRSLATGRDTSVRPEIWRLQTRLVYRWSSVVRWDESIPDPDVVHVIGAWNGLGYQAMHRALRKSIPVVWEPAGMLAQQGNHAAVKRALQPYHHYLSRRCQAMVWTSEIEKRESPLRHDGLNSYTRPNAGPAQPRVFDRQEARAALNLPAEGVIWGYLGRISERKGIETILSNWPEQQEDRWLVLAGPVENQQLCQRIDAAAGNVIRLESLDEEQKWVFLNAIDCLLLTPAFGENFGNVVVEAASVNTPVICSKAVGAAEYFSDPGVVRLSSLEELGRFFSEGRLPANPGKLPEVLSASAVAQQQMNIYNGVAA